MYYLYQCYVRFDRKMGEMSVRATKAFSVNRAGEIDTANEAKRGDGGGSHIDCTMVDKCLQLAARDYERRWGCAPPLPNPEYHIYLRLEMPQANLCCWLNSMEN